MQKLPESFSKEFVYLQRKQRSKKEMKAENGRSMERILLCKPKMSGNEIGFIREALAEDWAVPLGPDVNAFESELKGLIQKESEGAKEYPLASHLGTEEITALSSGTAAMHLAMMLCGIGKGDEVIVQSFTFCASSNPAVYLGATPVFVDSEPETWNMAPALLETAIKDRIEKTGKKPKAIVPVALYGMPYDIKSILKISDKYGIPVIEDAAEGFCSRFGGRILGTFGKFGVLSFNGNKMITTSGGGALICPGKEEKEKALWLATQARESFPYYQHEAIGYNYRLSNISACIGRGQLTVLPDYLRHHRHVQDMYRTLLKDIPGITLHDNPSPLYDSNFWLCTVTLDPELKIKGEEHAYAEKMREAVGGAAGVLHSSGSDRSDCEPNRNVEALRLYLNEANIESRPLWKPMHLQPVYEKNPAYLNGVSENLFRRGLCLPAGPYVTDEHLRFISDTIKDAVSI